MDKTTYRFDYSETFEISTQIVCVDIDDLNDTIGDFNPRITVGKVYTVLNEPKFQVWTGIEIEEDINPKSTSFYHPNRFITMEEYRKTKIENFIKEN